MVSSVPLMRRSRDLALGGLVLAGCALAGCAYYEPHSLVATNIRTTDRDALTSGSKRIEATVCGGRVLSIPFGPDPRITALMNALQDQVTNAVGFEDIEIDTSRVNYFFWLYYEDCIHGSAFPLFPVMKASPRPTAKAAFPPPAPAPPQPAAPEESGSPADPFAK
jgi:hypothetical protein